ncbi:metal-dependent hydrolase [Thiotrichales bacterium 19S11-10]|nr:metal-dependent hydrolase [Thiotrichales bacterium 19S11-10]MCF6807225.1 metal-dependent hydrolase [Thiotrichales bacterium 19S9-11]MCF6811194.1 metal-dependent hydrolase [Thiotrichales bacterium 19S9-12]
MANLNTHLTTSVSFSTVASICLYNTEVISLNQSIDLTLLGIFAGLLADLDSDTPYASQLIYSLLGMIAAIGIILNYSLEQFSILMNIIIFFFIYAVSRFGLSKVMVKITQRRGVFHSIPMAILISLVTVIIATHITHSSAEFAWWAGVYVLFNYLLHLLLDEIYATNLANESYRTRFLSSFKIFSARPWWPYLIADVLIIATLFFLPSFDVLINDVLAPSTFQQIWNGLV